MWGGIQSIPGENGLRGKKTRRVCEYEYGGLLELVVGKLDHGDFTICD